MGIGYYSEYTHNVALRKESVDRNEGINFWQSIETVALRKESVDRNIVVNSVTYADPLSLSARRAWIEMHWLDTAF